MDTFNDYKDYKSIIDAKITEDEMYKLFTLFPAYSNYTIQNYNTIVTWQAQRYQHLGRLYLYRKNEKALSYFCAKAEGKIRDE